MYAIRVLYISCMQHYIVMKLFYALIDEDQQLYAPPMKATLNQFEFPDTGKTQ